MGKRRHSTGTFGKPEEKAICLRKIIIERNSFDISRLFLSVYKSSPYEKESIDANVLLTVVKLREERGRQRREDIYWFDIDGMFLKHKFLDCWGDSKGIETVVNKGYDASTKRLRGYWKDIMEMLERALIPESLAEDITVKRLKNNEIEE